jgi:hypothetical protein
MAGERLFKTPNFDTLPYPAEEIDGAIERLLKTREVPEKMKEALRSSRLKLYIDPFNPEGGGMVKAPLRDKLWPKD